MPATVSLAVSAALVNAGAGAATALAIGAIAQNVLVSVAISGASQMLAKRKEAPRVAGIDSTISTRSPAATHKLIYGEVRTGGAIVDINNGSADGQKYWVNLVILFAAHECESIEQIYFDDYPLDIVWTGDEGYERGRYAGKTGAGSSYAYINRFLGRAGQQVPPILATHEGYTAADRFTGLTGIVLRLQNFRGDSAKDLWPGGFPPQVSAVIRGKRCIDPRDGQTRWTRNWALCVADYVQSAYACPGSACDTPLLIAAANVSDEPVALAGGGSEPRYCLDGVVDTGVDWMVTLRAMLTAAAGTAVPVGGRLWELRAGAWSMAGIGPALTEDDLRADYTVHALLPRDELCNRVKGVYADKDSRFAARDIAPVKNATYLSQDGEELWADLDLPFTTSSAGAQRVAKIHMEASRQQIVVEWPGTLACYTRRVGDIVPVTLAAEGWAAKLFGVKQATLVITSDRDGHPLVACDLVLRETAAATYTWSAEETTVDPAPDTSLPDPFRPPAPPAPTITTDLVADVAGGGELQYRIVISLPAEPTGLATYTEWAWRVAGTSTWRGRKLTVLPETSITASLYLVAGQSIEARARYWIGGTYASDWGPIATKLGPVPVQQWIGDGQISGLHASKLGGQIGDAQISGIHVSKLGGQLTGGQIGLAQIDAAQLALTAASQLSRYEATLGNVGAQSAVCPAGAWSEIYYLGYMAVPVFGARRVQYVANVLATWSSVANNTQLCQLVLRIADTRGSWPSFGGFSGGNLSARASIGNLYPGSSFLSVANQTDVQNLGNGSPVAGTTALPTGTQYVHFSLLLYNAGGGSMTPTFNNLTFYGEVYLFESKR
jgi:hypothetical protein